MVRDFNDHLKFQHWVYEEKKLKCKHCNFGPSSKYVLDMHVRDLHPRGYTCYSCGKTFRNLFETSGENSQHFEFVKHLRSAHGLTNYFCHQCGFETDRIIKFAIHEHVQHMLLDDVEKVYGRRNKNTFEENEGIDLNVSNGSSKKEYIDEDDILNGEECAEIDTENYENEGNMENDDSFEISSTKQHLGRKQTAEHRPKNDLEEKSATNVEDHIFVDHRVGKTYKKFKLFQLDEYPEHNSIVTSGNTAVIICNGNTNYSARGHFDCYSWGPSSGTRKVTKVNTYKCKKTADGCLASKKKWKCIGKCEFEDNFCCTYGIPERQSSIVVYINSYNHDVDSENTILIDDIGQSISEDGADQGKPVEDVDEQSEDVDEQSLEIQLNHDSVEEWPTNNVKRKPSYSSMKIKVNEESKQLNDSNEDFEIEANQQLTKILKNIKRYRPFSQVKETGKQSMKENEMLDYFHVIRKEGKKVTEVCKDGYLYKRSHSKKSIPQLLPGTYQHINVYSCEGILVCPNQECEIYRRVTHLNQVQNKGQDDKTCKHCPPNSEVEMVLKECHAKKWILHNDDSLFIVVYYESNHTCGDQVRKLG